METLREFSARLIVSKLTHRWRDRQRLLDVRAVEKLSFATVTTVAQQKGALVVLKRADSVDLYGPLSHHEEGTHEAEPRNTPFLDDGSEESSRQWQETADN